MKKNIIVLAALLTALTAFTGCGNDSSSSSSKSDAAATTAASTEASSEATTEAASKTTTAKKTTEATTEATTESTADLDFEELAGHWIYEEQDAGSTEEYVGTPKGSVDIAVDGRYAYNDGSSLITGSIELAALKMKKSLTSTASMSTKNRCVKTPASTQ